MFFFLNKYNLFFLICVCIRLLCTEENVFCCIGWWLYFDVLFSLQSCHERKYEKMHKYCLNNFVLLFSVSRDVKMTLMKERKNRAILSVFMHFFIYLLVTIFFLRVFLKSKLSFIEKVGTYCILENIFFLNRIMPMKTALLWLVSETPVRLNWLFDWVSENDIYLTIETYFWGESIILLYAFDWTYPR